METQVKQYKLGGETMYTGTIQSQVSLQMLDLKWQKKKQDINSKKDTEGMTQDEILLDSRERHPAAAPSPSQSAGTLRFSA